MAYSILRSPLVQEQVMVKNMVTFFALRYFVNLLQRV